jgi:hypothetical protein
MKRALSDLQARVAHLEQGMEHMLEDAKRRKAEESESKFKDELPPTLIAASSNVLKRRASTPAAMSMSMCGVSGGGGAVIPLAILQDQVVALAAMETTLREPPRESSTTPKVAAVKERRPSVASERESEYDGNHNKALPCPEQNGRRNSEANWNGLHYGAAHGNLEICRMFLDHPSFAGCDSVDENQRTALHHAAEKGFAEVCGLLLAHRRFFSSLNARDHQGQTALHAAARQGHAGVVRLIMDAPHFTEFLCKDWQGHTALMVAAFRGYGEVARILIEQGRCAEVHRSDLSGLLEARAVAKASVLSVINKGLVLYGGAQSSALVAEFSDEATDEVQEQEQPPQISVTTGDRSLLHVEEAAVKEDEEEQEGDEQEDDVKKAQDHEQHEEDEDDEDATQMKEERCIDDSLAEALRERFQAVGHRAFGAGYENLVNNNSSGTITAAQFIMACRRHAIPTVVLSDADVAALFEYLGCDEAGKMRKDRLVQWLKAGPNAKPGRASRTVHSSKQMTTCSEISLKKQKREKREVMHPDAKRAPAPLDKRQNPTRIPGDPNQAITEGENKLQLPKRSQASESAWSSRSIVASGSCLKTECKVSASASESKISSHDGCPQPVSSLMTNVTEAAAVGSSAGSRSPSFSDAEGSSPLGSATSGSLVGALLVSQVSECQGQETDGFTLIFDNAASLDQSQKSQSSPSGTGEKLLEKREDAESTSTEQAGSTAAPSSKSPRPRAGSRRSSDAGSEISVSSKRPFPGKTFIKWPVEDSPPPRKDACVQVGDASAATKTKSCSLGSGTTSADVVNQSRPGIGGDLLPLPCDSVSDSGPGGGESSFAVRCNVTLEASKETTAQSGFLQGQGGGGRAGAEGRLDELRALYQSVVSGEVGGGTPSTPCFTTPSFSSELVNSRLPGEFCSESLTTSGGGVISGHSDQIAPVAAVTRSETPLPSSADTKQRYTNNSADEKPQSWFQRAAESSTKVHVRSGPKRFCAHDAFESVLFPASDPVVSNTFNRVVSARDASASPLTSHRDPLSASALLDELEHRQTPTGTESSVCSPEQAIDSMQCGLAGDRRLSLPGRLPDVSGDYLNMRRVSAVF